jgi:hypothetical protein
MNKYLFLDIDGVLNSTRFMKSNIAAIQAADTETAHALAWLDPVCVALLNRIVAETGCKVILSSSWRNIYRLKALSFYLGLRGGTFTLFGRTPYGVDTENGGTCWDRGAEIRYWLEANAEHPCVFAILDDDRFDIVDYFPAQFVNTCGLTGITEADAIKVISILNSE